MSREGWLEAGLALFAAEGEAAVSIERLARELHVAKAGFYWHFRDRADLLAAILSYWEEAYTVSVMREVEDAGDDDPWDRLRHVANLVIDGDLGRYDEPMLTWGRRDPAVKRRVTRHIRRRLAYVSALLAECGFAGNRLDLHASLFVGYVSWHDRIHPSESKQARRARVAALIDLLVRDLGRK